MARFGTVAIFLTFFCFVVWSNHITTVPQHFAELDFADPNCDLPPHLNNTPPPDADNLTIFGLLNGSFDALLETDDQYPDVVLLLGNTGVGKSTVAQILATNMSGLHYVVIPPRTPVIVDEDEEIGLPSTRSKTLVPNRKVFMQNCSDTPTVLYDCPGYQDNRGSVQDFGANYFLKRVVDNAKRLKMLFLVDYNSVVLGLGDRNSFNSLVDHAVKFCKDTQFYNESIGLIITKTPNSDAIGIIPDDDVIQNAVDFLEQYEHDLEEKLEEAEGTVEQEFIKNKLKLTAIFLKTDDESSNYNKISFARTPEKCGRLNSSESALHSKQLMLTMMNGLRYEIVNSSLFGFSLKEKTINDLRNTSNEINVGIVQNVSSLLGEFSAWYYGQEVWEWNGDMRRITDFARESHEKMVPILQNLIHMSNSNELGPVNVSKALDDSFAQVGFHVPYKFENFMERQAIFLNVLDEATGEVQFRNISGWVGPVKDLVDTLGNSLEWAQFCGQVENLSFAYEFHASIKHQCDQSKFKGLDFVGNCTNISVDAKIRDLSKLVSEKESELIESILTFALEPMTITDIGTNTTQVTGHFVRTDEIKYQHDQWQRLVIHASHYDGFYSDSRIALESLVILAPRWHLYYQTMWLQGRRALLVHPERAQNGEDGCVGCERIGGNGANGLNGNTGGPGGSLFGAGSRISNNASHFSIESKGGDGSPGQYGGHGGKGSDGRDPTVADVGPPAMDIPPYIRIFGGHPGFRGGNGGVGGKGAMGGRHGKISMTFFDSPSSSMVHLGFSNGSDPIVGYPGEGGTGGKHGREYRCSKSRPPPVFTEQDCHFWNTTKEPASAGNRGAATPGYISFILPKYSVIEWQTVLEYSLKFQNETNIETTEFIKTLQTNPEFQKRFQLKELLEEMIFLERLPAPGNNLTAIFTVFQKRVEQFYAAHERQLSSVDKKVVALIQSSIYSKLVGLSNPRTGIIVNISQYISSIISVIERLQENNALGVINEEKTNIVREIYDKIIQTKRLLSDIVIPSLDQVDGKLNASLDLVRDQFADLINKTKDTLWDLENQLRAAWTTLRQNQFFGALGMILKPISTIFSVSSADKPDPGVPIEGLVDLIGGDGALGLYNQYKDDMEKIEQLKKLVAECKKYLADAIRRKEEIERMFSPLVDSLKALIDGIIGEFEGSEPGSSDMLITRWQLKSKVDEVEYHLQILSEGIDDREFLFALENIQHTMSLFVDLHGKIEEYKNAGSFYNYIANINSANLTYFNIGDATLKQYVLEMDKRVLEDHIVRKVELARNAFLQWVFPFAKVFRDHYQNLFNRTGSSVEDDIRNIRDLDEVLKMYKSMTVSELDTHLIHTNFSSGLVSSRPFYVWENEWEIAKLLNGSKVQFQAYIKNSPAGLEAVKFREIEIKLRIKEGLSNDTTELEDTLYDEIQKFRVSMTHNGISNFRFGGKYFSMVGEPQTLLYNFETDEDGNHLGENEVVRKFRCGDFMFSPYTMWTLQLLPALPGQTDPAIYYGLKALSKFINVELTGKGIFVNENDELVDKLEVERYYEQDLLWPKNIKKF